MNVKTRELLRYMNAYTNAKTKTIRYESVTIVYFNGRYTNAYRDVDIHPPQK